MIEMIREKQWSRLGRNAGLVVLICIVVVSIGGCSKTVVNTMEAEKARPDPSTMVEPKPAKPLAGTVPLPKHLREQAAERKNTALKDENTRSLQGFVRDRQEPTPEK